MEDKKIRKRDTSEEKIINKRRKTDDSTNSDILIIMKDVRKENYWYRLLKPGFKSNSEITDKRHSIVESIFSELKVDEDVIFFEEYSSDESDESLSRGNKNPEPKYSSELKGYKKVHVPGNRNCLFWSLDMIVFDGSFGSYAQRQLIADHIMTTKIYILITLKEISANTLKKIRKNGELGGIVKLFTFSKMIDAKDSWIKHLQTLYLIEKKISGNFY